MARENESEMSQELAVGIGMELKKLRKVRGAHRAYVTRTLPAARESVKKFRIDGNKRDLLKYKEILMDKKDMLRSLDEKILDIMGEECDGEACIQEVEESESILMGVSEILAEIEEKLGTGAAMLHQAQMENVSLSGSSSAKKAKAKLPKLELQTFNGEPQDWPEFWDAFSSVIDQDEDLPDAVKFQYLRKSLLEPARSVISGFQITASNYRAAVELLQQRYAKPYLIKRAHMNAMMNIKDVYDERQIDKMRALHDKVETHYRGLKAMEVDEETYASIVVPVLLEKIPQGVRWNMIRGADTDHLEWNVGKFLEHLKKEVQVREIQVPIFGPGNSERRHQPSRRFPDKLSDGTATALHTFRADRFRKRCAFCQQEHEEEHCDQVTNVNARKNIVRKYGRCFICIRKGHKAVECRSRLFCKVCNGRHHVTLCERNRDSQPSKSMHPANPTAPPIVGSILGSANVTSCTSSLGPTSSAALQTAQAIVNGSNENTVRVLFDSGSQKTFVTRDVVEKAKLGIVRKETLGIKTFGSEEIDRKVRNVVELDLRAMNRGRRVKIEAYVVEKISDVANCHVEHVQMLYPHLTSIEFSDVSDEDCLRVDVLVGADYLWDFQGQETIRGKKNEPVAVRTELGWVLSGPLRGKSIIQYLNSINVAFVETSLENKVEKFWDLDTVGIREDRNIYSKVSDDITYDGERYSVSLPWKIGHKQLSSNFNTTFARLKSQIRKLKETPALLDECSDIIQDQEEKGIIEKVTELEQGETVYYMPSQVVVRENAETTKVRMVFDASSKEGKNGTSLNECLHVGPNLTPLLFDILIRFRENNIALVGDIEKAFLNVGIHEADRDCLRFLWVEDVHDKDLSHVVYRFKRIVFGVGASPFLLTAVIRNHVTKFQDIDPEFVAKLVQSFFVDDLCTGARTVEETIDLYEKADSRMQEGGFRLRKWKSNNREVREYLRRKR